MRTKVRIISLLFLFIIGSWVTPQIASAQGPSISFQVFYDELSPYGTWVDNPDYGYVWIPNVAPGFTPYATNGYWVFTDDGWTWVSNYSWGWAPFHYGRWYTDPTYGPMWVPDNEWGPGWVTWRRSEGYYGWAPIGPGISISVAYGNGYYVPYNQWRFVRDRDFGRRDINNYYINSTTNITIIKYSTVINNTRIDRSRHVTYNSGPERAEVEKRVGRKFAPVTIKETNKPGEKLNQNQLQIYRPQVQKTTPTGHKPAPTRVESLKNVKTPAKRAVGTSPVKAIQPDKQPIQQQRKDQPVKQQPAHQQQKTQPVKQQTPPQRQKEQPAKQQPVHQHQKTQPAKQQTPPQRQKEQPVKQQPAKQQPAKQQPVQQHQNTQPAKQQTPPQQHNVQPAKQKQSQPQQHGKPTNNKDKEGEKPPH